MTKFKELQGEYDKLKSAPPSPVPSVPSMPASPAPPNGPSEEEFNKVKAENDMLKEKIKPLLSKYKDLQSESKRLEEELTAEKTKSTTIISSLESKCKELELASSNVSIIMWIDNILRV